MNPILVLGSRVRDGQVSALLASRLDTALSLADAHPARPIVVSGLGEAAAMAEYLTRRGAVNVIEEPAATSTNENLENARALFPDTAGWTVVTNGFHSLRTRLWAWHLGIPVTIVRARTPREWRVRMLARECFALPHSALRVLWRRIRALKN